MRKTLLLTASILALGSAANAGEVTTGRWTTYHMMTTDTGKPMCGMQSFWANSQGQRVGGFFVKYVLGNANFTFQIAKTTWNFPRGDQSVNVPMTIGFDKNPAWTVTAHGYNMQVEGKYYPTVEWYMTPQKIEDFLGDFGNANAMWFKFEQGTEAPWVAQMEGSRTSAKYFRYCVSEMTKRYGSQPYAQTPQSQPYSQDQTGQTQTPAPSDKKKDDGSI